jgi:small subunit ribosomal protein S20
VTPWSPDTPGGVVSLVATRRACYHFEVRPHPHCDGHHSNIREGPIQLANIKSQKKRVLTNLKAQERNKSVRSAVKTAVKKVHEAVASSDKDAATEQLVAASRALDKAVSKGVVHKNQAANRKSGLAKLVDTIES